MLLTFPCLMYRLLFPVLLLRLHPKTTRMYVLGCNLNVCKATSMLFKKKKIQQLYYFVSIGSGLNQIPLIQEAKKQGCHVIGVESSASAAGFYLCDLKIQESIENYNIIYKKLLELLVDGEIYGILSKSYGQAIITTSYLTEKFKIPFLPFAVSGSFVDKRKMKSIFAKHEIPTPDMISLTSRTKFEKIPADAYPIIIKPNIGHAKINVRMAGSADELNKVINRRERIDGDYILEKFVTGDEII